MTREPMLGGRMTAVTEIGEPLVSGSEIIAEMAAFLDLYRERPHRDNDGGMKAPHMFATWVMLRKLRPSLVIESGVFRGQGTWLIEHAVPDAELICIDPSPTHRTYTASRAQYFEEDFSRLDWRDAPADTVAFFDDHQNAYDRAMQCRWFGIKHMIFEDNYAAGVGDCYSLKKAFAMQGAARSHMTEDGYAIAQKRRTLKGELSYKITKKLKKMGVISDINLAVPKNGHDAALLQRNLERYFEFPPVVRSASHRFGPWRDDRLPTKPPVIPEARRTDEEIFAKDAPSYTWICYAALGD